MRYLLIVFLPCIVSSQLCAFSSSVQQLTNEISTCIDPTDGAPSDVYLAAIDDIAIDECIRTSNKDDCDKLITSYASDASTQSDFMKKLGVKLVEDPTKACTCIDKYTPSTGHCLMILDDFDTYCAAFYPDTINDSTSPDDNDDATDDTDDDVIDTSEYKDCFELLTNVCDVKYDYALTYEDSISCILNDPDITGNKCDMVLDGILASLNLACGDDFTSECVDSLGNPSDALICLAKSKNISPVCRRQISDIGTGDNVPCNLEANNLCKEFDNIEDTLTCLALQDPGKLSYSCMPLVQGYSVCASSSTGGSSNPKAKSKPKPKRPSSSKLSENHLERRLIADRSILMNSFYKLWNRQLAPSRPGSSETVPCWMHYSEVYSPFASSNRDSPSLMMIALVSVCSVLFSSLSITLIKSYCCKKADSKGRYKRAATSEEDAEDAPDEEDEDSESEDVESKSIEMTPVQATKGPSKNGKGHVNGKPEADYSSLPNA